MRCVNAPCPRGGKVEGNMSATCPCHPSELTCDPSWLGSCRSSRLFLEHYIFGESTCGFRTGLKCFHFPPLRCPHPSAAATPVALAGGQLGNGAVGDAVRECSMPAGGKNRRQHRCRCHPSELMCDPSWLGSSCSSRQFSVRAYVAFVPS